MLTVAQEKCGLLPRDVPTPALYHFYMEDLGFEQGEQRIIASRRRGRTAEPVDLSQSSPEVEGGEVVSPSESVDGPQDVLSHHPLPTPPPSFPPPTAETPGTSAPSPAPNRSTTPRALSSPPPTTPQHSANALLISAKLGEHLNA